MMDAYVALRGFEHEGSEPIGVTTTLEAAQALCAADYANATLVDEWPDEGPLDWTAMQLVRGYETQSVHLSRYYEVRVMELHDAPAAVS